MRNLPIISNIISLIKREKKELPLYSNVQIPAGMTINEFQRVVNKAYLSKNAELEGELARTQAILDEYMKRDRQKREEENILENAELFYDAFDKLKKEKMVGLRFYTYYRDDKGKKELKEIKYEDLPTLFLANDDAVGKMCGVLLRPSKDGRFFSFYPWLMDEDGKYMNFNASAPDFASMFRDSSGVISQLVNGKIDSNFDLVDGKPIFHDDSYLGEVRNRNKNDSMKKTDLKKIERQNYEREIMNLRDDMSSLMYELKEYDKENTELKSVIAKLERKSELASATSEIFATGLKSMMEDTKEVTQYLTDSISMVNNLTFRQKISENMSAMLLKKITEMQEKVAGNMSKEDEEMAMEKVFDVYKKISTISERASKVSSLKDEEIKRVIGEVLSGQRTKGE